MKGVRLGDLCAETGHFLWARKLWSFTLRLIEAKDYADWRYVWFNTERVRLSHVASETECELLSRRLSDLWRALGHSECAWWNEEREHLSESTFGSYYTDLWAEKYGADLVLWQQEYDEMLRADADRQATERLFRDAQTDSCPPCAQDFFDYWSSNA